MRAVDWAVAQFALPGQPISGDRHLVVPFENGMLLALVDGIGHGPEASHAASIATSALRRQPRAAPAALLDRCHADLMGTRGAVMTIASLNLNNNTMTWCGVGDVEALHCRDGIAGAENLVSRRAPLRGGTIGSRLPAVVPDVISLQESDLIILTTDGIRWGFERGFPSKAPPQRIADIIIDDYSKGTDDACVLVARFLGANFNE